MANKITYTVKTTNSTRRVLYWNPSTLTYTPDNPILNIPAGTYSGLKARFEGDPEIIATISKSVIVTDASTLPPEYTGGTPVYLMAMGDSNATDFKSQAWPRQTEFLLDLDYYSFMRNLSVGGDRLAHVIDRLPTYIASWDKTKYSQAIAVINTGVNNTIDLMDFNTMIAQYEQITSTLTNAGIKSIFVTFSPNRGQYQANPSLDAQQLALRNAINNELITNGVSKHGFTAVVDTRADTYIGLDDAPIDGQNTYFDVDKLHLLTPAQVILASYIAPVIKTITGPSSPIVVAPNTYTYRTHVGTKDTATGSVIIDGTTSVGNERVSGAFGFAPNPTDKTKNTVSFPLYSMHMRGNADNTGSIYGLCNRTDGRFADNSYFGLFSVEGVLFSPANDTFYAWHNGNYDASQAFPFTDGQIMTLQYDGFKIYVLLDGVQQFEITLPNANVPNAHFDVYRANQKIGPVIFKAENPLNNPF